MPTADPHAAATKVIGLALEAGVTLITAESCTAGRLSSALAAVDGAGKVFHGGFVTYSIGQKTLALDVEADVLRSHSAVSAPVARAMAKGALAKSRADVALAVTGVAGPERDEAGNPVGLVYVAAIHRAGRALEKECRFDGSPEEICLQAVDEVLSLAARVIT